MRKAYGKNASYLHVSSEVNIRRQHVEHKATVRLQHGSHKCKGMWNMHGVSEEAVKCACDPSRD